MVSPWQNSVMFFLAAIALFSWGHLVRARRASCLSYLALIMAIFYHIAEQTTRTRVVMHWPRYFHPRSYKVLWHKWIGSVSSRQGLYMTSVVELFILP